MQKPFLSRLDQIECDRVYFVGKRFNFYLFWSYKEVESLICYNSIAV